MLGKMLKHEFIATGRSFLPMYLFMIILTPVFSLIIRLGASESSFYPSFIGIFAGLSMFGFVCMMIGIFIGSFIFIILRFYQTTATSEAYLTFTLPVTTHEVLISKLLTAIVWQICSGILAVCSILVMTFITGVWTPTEFLDLLFSYLTQFDRSGTAIIMKFCILFFIMLFTGTITGTLQIFCSIMLGQLFRDHRVIGSIAVYLGFYTFMQIISSFMLIIISRININSVNINSVDYSPDFGYIFILSSLANLIFAVAYYLISSFVMKKHLNVQ